MSKKELNYRPPHRDLEQVSWNRSPGTGVIFLKKTDIQRTFPCDKRIINVEKSNVGEINIVDHTAKLNLTKLINSERMPYIEDKATELKKKIKINSDIIELFAGKTQQKLQETELNLKKLEIPILQTKTIHAGLLLQIVSITVAISISLSILVICYKNLRKCFKPKKVYRVSTISERRRRQMLLGPPTRRFRAAQPNQHDAIIESAV